MTTQRKPSEKQIQTQILKYLKQREDCWCVKVVVANQNGTPDILCCKNGKFYAFEVKSEKGKPTALQLYAMNKIHTCGGVAVIAKSVEDVKAALEE